MNTRRLLPALIITLLSLATLAPAQRAQTTDPLPSWNDAEAKSAITDFVDRVTNQDSDDFVPPPQRIAVFDNDGTLWSEQPLYFQALWAFDRIRDMAPEHPEWRDTEPYKSIIEGDLESAMAAGEDKLIQAIINTHGDMTAEQFRRSVADWLATARHPETGMPYTDMVYQPMLELLDYLRQNDFKTFIVSGGGIDFMRVFAEQVYGIPPEQIVGSSVNAEFTMQRGVPTITKKPDNIFVDDKAGKPVGIYQHIGRRPILAAGNSDGDLQMLQYTTIPRDQSDTTPRLGLIVHHTDDAREWAYDRDSHIGKLDQALDQADQRGWIIIDMKNDWRRIYPRASR